MSSTGQPVQVTVKNGQIVNQQRVPQQQATTPQQQLQQQIAQQQQQQQNPIVQQIFLNPKGQQLVMVSPVL